jgi:hypothetical protein
MVGSMIQAFFLVVSIVVCCAIVAGFNFLLCNVVNSIRCAVACRIAPMVSSEVILCVTPDWSLKSLTVACPLDLCCHHSIISPTGKRIEMKEMFDCKVWKDSKLSKHFKSVSLVRNPAPCFFLLPSIIAEVLDCGLSV